MSGCPTKEAINRMKKQPTERKKTSAKSAFDSGLVSRISKNFKNLKNDHQWAKD